jgi:hypothetical protein
MADDDISLWIWWPRNPNTLEVYNNVWVCNYVRICVGWTLPQSESLASVTVVAPILE